MRIALPSGEIDEGRGHLAPVAELERALAQPAAGHHADRVGGAAVDLDKGDQALAIAAARLLDAQASAAQHRHAHTQDLSRAKMAVGDFGLAAEVRRRSPRIYGTTHGGTMVGGCDCLGHGGIRSGRY